MVQKAMKILKTDTKKAIYVGDSELVPRFPFPLVRIFTRFPLSYVRTSVSPSSFHDSQIG